MPENTAPPLGEYLAKGKNSFGFLRILAAISVVFSHSWPVAKGSWYPEPLQLETGYTLGWHAVNLFFALSGLLIAGSLNKNNSISTFLVNRLLRIYPALIVVTASTVLLSAFLVNTSIWNSASALEYVIKNFFLVGSSATISGVFENNPDPDLINVPLWTLKYEVFAYFTIAMISALSWKFPRIFYLKYFTLFVLSSSAIAMIYFDRMEGHSYFHHLTRLMFSFYLGVAFWLWRDRIRISVLMLVNLGILNAAFLFIEFYYLPAQILLLLGVSLWIGCRRFGALSEFTDDQDYSYGIYIFGYPIQQAAMAYTNIPNPWYEFTVAMIFVLPVAALSWNLIERPALRFKIMNSNK